MPLLLYTDPYLFSPLDLLVPQRALQLFGELHLELDAISVDNLYRINCARVCDKHMDDVLLHTYLPVYIHTYISTGYFLVCMIYVGLASAHPN